jgi:hypothetical protein
VMKDDFRWLGRWLEVRGVVWRICPGESGGWGT